MLGRFLMGRFGEERGEGVRRCHIPPSSFPATRYTVDWEGEGSRLQDRLLGDGGGIGASRLLVLLTAGGLQAVRQPLLQMLRLLYRWKEGWDCRMLHTDIQEECSRGCCCRGWQRAVH